MQLSCSQASAWKEEEVEEQNRLNHGWTRIGGCHGSGCRGKKMRGIRRGLPGRSSVKSLNPCPSVIQTILCRAQLFDGTFTTSFGPLRLISRLHRPPGEGGKRLQGGGGAGKGRTCKPGTGRSRGKAGCEPGFSCPMARNASHELCPSWDA